MIRHYNNNSNFNAIRGFILDKDSEGHYGFPKFDGSKDLKNHVSHKEILRRLKHNMNIPRTISVQHKQLYFNGMGWVEALTSRSIALFYPHMFDQMRDGIILNRIKIRGGSPSYITTVRDFEARIVNECWPRISYNIYRNKVPRTHNRDKGHDRSAIRCLSTGSWELSTAEMPTVKTDFTRKVRGILFHEKTEPIQKTYEVKSVSKGTKKMAKNRPTPFDMLSPTYKWVSDTDPTGDSPWYS